MGRKSTNPVGKLYFTYSVEKNESICQIEGCHRPIIKGRHSHNLETHIRTTHSKESTILINAKKDIKERENVFNQNEKRQIDISTTQSIKVNYFIILYITLLWYVVPTCILCYSIEYIYNEIYLFISKY